jgi:hypothetical protein
MKLTRFSACANNKALSGFWLIPFVAARWSSLPHTWNVCWPARAAPKDDTRVIRVQFLPLFGAGHTYARHDRCVDSVAAPSPVVWASSINGLCFYFGAAFAGVGTRSDRSSCSVKQMLLFLSLAGKISAQGNWLKRTREWFPSLIELQSWRTSMLSLPHQ